MNKRLVCVVMPMVMLFCSACGAVVEDTNNKKLSKTMSTDNFRFIESETYVVITDATKSETTTTETETVMSTSKKEEKTTKKSTVTSAIATDVVVALEPSQTTTLTTTAKRPETSTVEMTNPQMPTWKTETVEELTAPNLEDCFIPNNSQNNEDDEELPTPTIEAWETVQETLGAEGKIDNYILPTEPKKSETVIEEIPQSVVNAIKEQQKKYPHMQVAVGFFSLDGSKGYVYNGNTKLFGACTIKAAYACFVLQEAQERGIDIEQYKIKCDLDNDIMSGSGDIQYSSKRYYTVKELLQKLISISDNTAYKILDKVFSVDDFKDKLKDIGGATEFKNRYFSYTNVYERYNEWQWIYNYEQTGTEYAQYLEELLKGAQAYYLGIGSYTQHQHKSGWTENDAGNMYTACDAGIVSGKYILVILTRDDFAEAPNADPVRAIGRSVNSFVVNNNVF